MAEITEVTEIAEYQLLKRLAELNENYDSNDMAMQLTNFSSVQDMLFLFRITNYYGHACMFMSHRFWR